MMALSLNIVWLLMCISVLVASLSGVFTSNLKSLMGYSSIIHTSWLCPMTKYSPVWLVYLFLYSVVLSSFIHQLQVTAIKTLAQVSLQSTSQASSFIVSLLSLSGVPPTLGFAMKWLLILMLSQSSFSLISVMMLIALSVYFYIQVVLHLLSRITWQPSTNYSSMSTMSWVLLNSLGMPVVILMS